MARRSGGVLLKLIEQKSVGNTQDGIIDLKSLIHHTKKISDKGFPLYVYDINRKGDLTSEGFWYDIKALASANAIEVVSKNPHIKITEDGKKIADNLKLPPKLESVIGTF